LLPLSHDEKQYFLLHNKLIGQPKTRQSQVAKSAAAATVVQPILIIKSMISKKLKHQNQQRKKQIKSKKVMEINKLFITSMENGFSYSNFICITFMGIFLEIQSLRELN